MKRRPTRTKRTDTIFPDTTLFRSPGRARNLALGRHPYRPYPIAWRFCFYHNEIKGILLRDTEKRQRIGGIDIGTERCSSRTEAGFIFERDEIGRAHV